MREYIGRQRRGRGKGGGVREYIGRQRRGRGGGGGGEGEEGERV